MMASTSDKLSEATKNEGKSKKVFSTELSWTLVIFIYSLNEYLSHLKKPIQVKETTSWNVFKTIFSWNDDDKPLITPPKSQPGAPEVEGVTDLLYQFGLVFVPYFLSWSYWALKKTVTSKRFFRWLDENNHPYVKGYINAIFLKKDDDKDKDRIEHYAIYATIAFVSYQVGAALFYYYTVTTFRKLHVNKRLNVRPIHIHVAGFIGVFLVPILFYLPEIILNITLGSLFNNLKKPRKKSKKT